MNSKIQYLLILLNIVMIGYIVFLEVKQHYTPYQNVYVINQDVFDQFKGKKEIENKLTAIKARNKSELDSLYNITATAYNDKVRSLYEEKAKKYAYEESVLAEQYTQAIWKQINQYINDYGKANKYDFIYGASGNGNLMYAGEHKNVTQEVINYINSRYEGQ
jgi:Skp family chaperone for outer membrane proteins